MTKIAFERLDRLAETSSDETLAADLLSIATDLIGAQDQDFLAASITPLIRDTALAQQRMALFLDAETMSGTIACAEHIHPENPNATGKTPTLAFAALRDSLLRDNILSAREKRNLAFYVLARALEDANWAVTDPERERRAARYILETMHDTD